MDRSLARSSVYRMLSVFFSYPDQGVRSLIINGKERKALRQCLNVLDEEYFSASFEKLESESGVRKMPGKREMIREYERIFSDFRGDENRASAASSYMRGVWSILRQKKCEAVDAYQDFDSEFKTSRIPMSDMICHELKFMGVLSELESRANSGEKIRLEEVQLDFLSRFIVPCIPDFCDGVIKISFLDFYRALGMLTREFVGFEENYLGVPEEIEKG
jgi:TorA maturation chaperone TorD